MNSICNAETLTNIGTETGGTNSESHGTIREARPWYSVHWSLLAVLGAASAELIILLARPALAEAIAMRFL
jgi:hypothetical protein